MTADTAVGKTPAEPTPTLDAPPDPFFILIPLLKRWRWAVLIPLTMAVATAIVSFLLPARYSARVSFIADQSSGLQLDGALSGLAGQLGVRVPGQDRTESPEFYVALSRSEHVLTTLVVAPYHDPDGLPHDSATLVDIFDVKGQTPQHALQIAVAQLDRITTRRINNLTGVIELVVPARDPVLAATIANRFVEVMDAFNRDVRRSRARAKREFLETRLDVAREAMQAQQDELRKFTERNRRIEGSPELQLERTNLEQALRIEEETFLGLTRSLETSRIEEIDDRPLLTVIDRAIPPPQRSWPKRKILVVVVSTLTGLLTLAGIYVVEYGQRLRAANTSGFEHFTRALADVRTDITKIFRRAART